MQTFSLLAITWETRGGSPYTKRSVCILENLCMTVLLPVRIKWGMDRDPLLSCVKENVLRGWRDVSASDEEMRPFQSRKNDLSVHDGSILWGSRVVVPPQDRERILLLLHEGHPGEVRMKGLACVHVWWPGLNMELENRVKSYNRCQQVQKNPAPTPLHPWEWPV